MTKQEKKILPVNLLIIEDNRFIRNGWEILLGASGDFKITGSYSNCEDALKSDVINESDMVLMDIGLPGMSGIEGVKLLKEINESLIIVMCTVYEEDDKIFKALCAGAVGYLLKKTSPEELKKALLDAYYGGSPMTPSVARKVIDTFHTTTHTEETEKLTEREKEILQLMAKGKSYSAIADELFLSVDGVYYHIRHIYEKLHVHTRAEAVAVSLKKKLIPPIN